MGTILFLILVIIATFALVYVAAGVKVVRPYQRGVVERLGRYKETTDPGLRLILPFIESLKKVDMREQVIDVPPQEVITEDNVAVSVDAVVYFEPTDPQRLLYNISNFVLAVTKLAQTNLRNVIGEMTLDEAFTSRERVNAALRQILDDATDKWGVRVVRVEIQRIDPPADVMHAMHEQMKAERTRRAVVTEAEGSREAAITRAEGEKQSAILTAEGQRQKDILNAEGQAQAVRTRAEAEQYRQQVVAAGEANAIRSVYSAIIDSGTDDRVVAIKYLESLRAIADGQATKIFLPADMGASMGTIGAIGELFNSGRGFGLSEPQPDRAPVEQPSLASQSSGSVRAPERTSASLTEAAIHRETRGTPPAPSALQQPAPQSAQPRPQPPRMPPPPGR